MTIEPGPRPDPPLVRARDANREPIFRSLPLGMLVMAAAMLAGHALFGPADEQTRMRALAAFAIVPARLDMGTGGAPLGEALFWQAMPFLAHQFMHGGVLHLGMNALMLLQVGPLAERALAGGRVVPGAMRFAALFLLSGVAGGLLYCLVNPHSFSPTVGASGAISGVFAGYLWAVRHQTAGRPGVLRPILVSAGVFLALNVGLAALARVTGFLPIAWEAHHPHCSPGHARPAADPRLALLFHLIVTDPVRAHPPTGAGCSRTPLADTGQLGDRASRIRGTPGNDDRAYSFRQGRAHSLHCA
jgi:membrane associated rhomboid family serine protease